MVYRLRQDFAQVRQEAVGIRKRQLLDLAVARGCMVDNLHKPLRFRKPLCTQPLFYRMVYQLYCSVLANFSIEDGQRVQLAVYLEIAYF